MSFLSGFVLLSGRGVAGATFAIGSELLVEVSEVELIATDEVDTETVIVQTASAEITVGVEAVDIVLAPVDGDLSVG